MHVFKTLWFAAVISLGAASGAPGTRTGDAGWPVIPPEELAASASPIEADAPAEVLSWKIDLDDSAYPGSSTTIEYVRYKVYAPERAERATRITFTNEGGTEVTASARLTLPDGKSTVFGKESVREHTGKTATRSQVTQMLLAVEGVTPGSIVEFQIKRVIALGGTSLEFAPNFGLRMQPLQRDNLPVRFVEWKCRYPETRDFSFTYSVLNPRTAQAQKDEKQRVCTITATNLPSTVDEPRLGPRSDYTTTLLFSYNKRSLTFHTWGVSALAWGNMDKVLRADKNAGPWARLAAIVHMIEQTRAKPTHRVKELATRLAEGASSDIDKATRIHRGVQQLYVEFTHTPRRQPPSAVMLGHGQAYFAGSLDDVLGFKAATGPIIEDMDFFWLSLALYRAAGLETKAVLLPDRRLTRFDPRFVSAFFLTHAAVAVRIGSEWHFSHPLSEQPMNLNDTRRINVEPTRGANLLPFGMLPWQHEGQNGLFVQPNREEFVPIPLSTPERSMIATGGVFQLSAEGTLSGKGMRRYTGQHAFAARSKLSKEPPEKRAEAAGKLLESDLPGAEIEVSQVNGFDDPEMPLQIDYTLNWPGYAAATKDRLIFLPAVFRKGATAPFSSDTRRHPVHFHHPWQEADRVAIKLPAGYQLESPSAPVSLPGEALHFRTQYFFDSAKKAFTADRDFSSRLIDVPVEHYSQLKSWYDLIAVSDRKELVLVKTAEQALTANTPATVVETAGK